MQARTEETARWPLVTLIVALTLLLAITVVDRFLWPILEPAISGRVVADAAPVDVTVGRDRLSIPANMFRFTDQRRGGPQARVDLFLKLPDLTGWHEADADAFNEVGPQSPIVFVALTPREGMRDPAQRFVEVYQRFVEGPAVDGPDGLVGRRLRVGSGYDDETIYVENGRGPYTARCFAETGGAPPTCLMEFWAGRDLVAQARFRKHWLEHWRVIDRALKERVAGFSPR